MIGGGPMLMPAGTMTVWGEPPVLVAVLGTHGLRVVDRRFRHGLVVYRTVTQLSQHRLGGRAGEGEYESDGDQSADVGRASGKAMGQCIR